ncbi:MAG: deoxyribodipyrimidine photolyase [Planctomycetaceae bacterium]
MPVPDIRIQIQNSADTNPQGSYVLYWMIANRRLSHNFALQRAVDASVEYGKPLLILEALKCDYQWASDRLHRFILQGMAINRNQSQKAGVSYHPFVETVRGEGYGLLHTLSADACLVVTDDFPCFFLPKMVRSVAERLSVRMEAVDSNGLYPIHATDRVFTRAFSFRNHLQKSLEPYLHEFPVADPLNHPDLMKSSCLPPAVAVRWPAADDGLLNADSAVLKSLPIDHSVGPAAMAGGRTAALQRLKAFVARDLSRYADDRSQPDDDPSSGLSPYLHFGHISAHEIFQAVAVSEEWSVDQLNDVGKTKGSREGWWNMSPSAESFLDELITWRELGYNACANDPSYHQYESLPEFARVSLEEHADDPRPVIYTPDQLRNAETHDEIWNAAQVQLLTEGRMHNYLRMLWGKKILEWSPTPRDALDVMIDLNNRYAVDGRNPNSYSGIFWVLGRYDRAWGPERPIFGKIRYMSSESTRRKLKLTTYLQKFGTGRGQKELF